jgi:hypothetical protein
VDDGVTVDVVDGGHDSIFQFLFGGDPDVAQHRAGKLGEEAFDEIEPRTMLGREDKGEAPFRLGGEPSPGFLGHVRRVIVEDELDRC